VREREQAFGVKCKVNTEERECVMKREREREGNGGEETLDECDCEIVGCGRRHLYSPFPSVIYLTAIASICCDFVSRSIARVLQRF
jgi:hypothetical protein